MKKRILVTGAAGLIGSFLCEKLLEKNYQVVAVDNFISGSRNNINHLSSNSNFKFIEHDICNPFYYDEKIDQVYHLACPASPDDFDKIPLEILSVCSRGTRHILELANSHKARFLFTSTSEVYGNPEIHPQKEDYWGHVNSIGPRSCYDEGKRFAESLVMTFHRIYKLPITVVRLFNTYGPRMRINDGRVVPNFIIQALKQQPLTIHGDGQQTRSFCYVSDLVKGLVLLQESDQTFGEVYNLGNPDEHTIESFAKAVCQVAKLETNIDYIPSPRQDDPVKRRPDISKVNEAVNWQPEISLFEGLEETLKYFKSVI